MGTILGALLHSGRGLAGEGGRPVYPGYGWPVVWKTNAPEGLIEHYNQQIEGGVGGYNKYGIRVTVFLAITVMWFLAALIAEGLVVLLGAQLWWLSARARAP
jgi:hypothetical protein